MVTILHYLNQFFAGIGGEDKAGQEVLLTAGALGAGAIIRDALTQYDVEYATIVCGDNYFHEEETKALKSIDDIVEKFQTGSFPRRPGFQRRQVRPCLRQGLQFRARQLAHPRRYRHARRKSRD